MFDDFDRCYGAVRSRDSRFDGWFITAVLTTGIYCRPSCPVPAPKPVNVRFFPSAAAAQHAGFRACKRCRPDAAPGSPEWNARADAVARSMRLIADGVVDREGVSGVARRIGYSVRQLERHLRAEVGAGPLALARAQRAQTARVLIETTAEPMAAIAFAAGFASIRQFNDTVQAVFGLTPTALRTRRRQTRTRPDRVAAGAIALRLPFRQPLSPAGLFGHLTATAVPGCEVGHRDLSGAPTYRRVLDLPGGAGIVSLSPRPDHISCELRLTELRDLPAAIARCRRLLDLDADPEAVDELLGQDPVLVPVIAKDPGQRVPRTVDEAELALRVVIGQQISTGAARTVAGRLVATLGPPVDDPLGELDRGFPRPAVIAAVDPATLPMPASRARTVVALAAAIAGGVVDLGPGADWEQARVRLREIPGIGPWTVEMIALRGLGDPDAFPASDLGVTRAADTLGIGSDLRASSERWRPWRGYATQYLWSTLDHPINSTSTGAVP